MTIEATIANTGTPRSIYVVMGVSGSGKTTIGEALAQRVGAEFIDADDYHPQANRDKMHAGIPLTDEDRWPWLTKLNDVLRAHATAGKSCVLACSALKGSYRELLQKGIPSSGIEFVLLDVPRDLLEQRLAHRHHEFMSSRLLDSQFATLEEPDDALKVSNDAAPSQVVQEILDKKPGPEDGTKNN